MVEETHLVYIRVDFVARTEENVVLQILSYTREIDQDRNTVTHSAIS
jgi:hypothetical protein